MAGDFRVVRPFIYVAGTPIDPNQNNPNENTLYTAFNASMEALTGHQHTGAPGDGGAPLGPGSLNLAADYPWTGNHSWSAPGGATFNTGITAHNGGLWDGSPTIVTPVIASFITAQHNHQNGAGGGLLNIILATIGTLTIARGGTSTTTATGTVGSSVVLADTPTILNATLTGQPTITDYTNAQHNHQNAVGGGVLDINLATTGTLSITRGGTGAVTPPGVNQVIYSDGAAYVGNPLFVWLNASRFLGIGLAAPLTNIHVQEAGADVEVRIERATSAGTSRVALIDGSGQTTTLLSDGVNSLWQLSRQNTYIRGNDALRCLEFASHLSAPGFGTKRIYTRTLATTMDVGGDLLTFEIQNNQWLMCKMSVIVSWQDAGGSKSACADVHFTVYRDGAGVKGIGGPGGTDLAQFSNFFLAYGGDRALAIQSPLFIGSSEELFENIATPGNNYSNYPRGLNPGAGGVGSGSVVTGALPQTFFPGGGTTNSLLFSDVGGNLITITYTPQTVGFPAANPVRVTAVLETVVSEYL